MIKRKINKKIFGWQGIIYRIFVICLNALFFRFGVKNTLRYYGVIGAFLAWNCINMVFYFFYHGVVLKLFSLEVETKGAVIWFTGLPSAGKTTMADMVAKKLLGMGKRVERLDGDIIRNIALGEDLGFTPEDRNKNIRRVASLAELLRQNDVIVLVSFITPYEEQREKNRKEIINYHEVYVKCGIKECIRRDVKGLYKRAINGEVDNFTGISAPYEEPQCPDLVCHTDKESKFQSANKVVQYILEKAL